MSICDNCERDKVCLELRLWWHDDDGVEHTKPLYPCIRMKELEEQI